MPKGTSSIIGFGIKGGKEAGIKFIDNQFSNGCFLDIDILNKKLEYANCVKLKDEYIDYINKLNNENYLKYTEDLSILKNILDRYANLDFYIEIYSNINNDEINKLYDPENNKDVDVLFNVPYLDNKTNTVKTADLLIVLPDGTVDIKLFESINAKEREGEFNINWRTI